VTGAVSRLARRPSVINCDNLLTVPKSVIAGAVGRLDLGARARLDQALRYALDIQY
jgi:mRNA-degrading endonuclease toxin of MazEF toxin-antitoxin module